MFVFLTYKQTRRLEQQQKKKKKNRGLKNINQPKPEIKLNKTLQEFKATKQSI